MGCIPQTGSAGSLQSRSNPGLRPYHQTLSTLDSDRTPPSSINTGHDNLEVPLPPTLPLTTSNIGQSIRQEQHRSSGQDGPRSRRPSARYDAPHASLPFHVSPIYQGLQRMPANKSVLCAQQTDNRHLTDSHSPPTTLSEIALRRRHRQSERFLHPALRKPPRKDRLRQDRATCRRTHS